MNSKDKLDAEFQKYLRQPPEQWSLAEGTLLIARQEYPRLDASKTLAWLEEMGKEAGKRLKGCRTPKEKISALNAFFFGDLGFHGNEEDYYDPRNSYLPDVVERKAGIPITLTALYLETAWRASFGLFGINFPGHFLAAWKESESDFRKNAYIDVFNGGLVLDEKGLQGLLDRFAGGENLDPARHLRNAGVREILHRVLANLKALHASLEKFDRALWAAEWMISLKPDDFASLRDKGMFLFSLGRLEAAEQALMKYLEATKRPEDYATVWRVLYSIKAQNPVRLN